MKLMSAFYCPECQEVFDYTQHRTTCPSCTNRFTFSLQLIWSLKPKEVQDETTKINRVYVTPARYDVCRAGTTKDADPGIDAKLQSDVDETADAGDRFKGDRLVHRSGVKAVWIITELLNRFDVYRKYWGPKGQIVNKLSGVDADTLAGILHRC